MCDEIAVKRKSIPKKSQLKIIVKSRRRCPLCVYLKKDFDEKQGQIAHLDKDPSNNKIKNLVFLCLNHHDKFDSKPSQSKSYSNEEIGYYRDKMYKEINEVLTKSRTTGENGKNLSLHTPCTRLITEYERSLNILIKDPINFEKFNRLSSVVSQLLNIGVSTPRDIKAEIN